MISKVRAILNVKLKREDSALRQMQEKRTYLRRALEARAQRARAFDESSSTLQSREVVLYNEIAKKVVGTPDVDVFREQIDAIHLNHQRLKEHLEAAEHQCIQLQQDVKNALQVYQIAQRSREKFERLLSDAQLRQIQIDELRDEAETEDIYCNRGVFQL